ncbi:MAG: hypothetical protein ABJM61_06405 [Yoonia sp.]|uniref:hypothetical protein n=2 Tax=Yoonia sp. TaxID=2212373 RepID=UPI003266BF66
MTRCSFHGRLSGMSLFRRLLPVVFSGTGLPVGLGFLRRDRSRQPKLGKPLPADKSRVHFFAGNFASKDAARHYCFHSERNVPEDLTRELPDAFIDIAHVEVVFGGHRERLSDFLDMDGVETLLREIDHKNTLVMIAEQAFGGFPYALNDTSVLHYIGDKVVDV